MKTYSRVQDGVVMELVSTGGDISMMYPPVMTWIECTSIAGIAPGWVYDGGSFAAPPPPPAPTVAQALGSLAAYRYSQQTSGVMFQPAAASAPILFPSTDIARGNVRDVVTAIAMGAVTDTNPWKVSATSFVNMTKADINGMFLKIAAYIAACYAREQVLTIAVTANAAVDITTGWPSNA